MPQLIPCLPLPSLALQPNTGELGLDFCITRAESKQDCEWLQKLEHGIWLVEKRTVVR